MSWNFVTTVMTILLNASGNITIGNINPFRYRGYYYDAETGLYYLASRYYDPEVSRFLNADTINALMISLTNLSNKNLYAYCDNNAVIRIDISGNVWETVFDIASLGVSIVEVAVNPSDPWAWAGLVGDTLDLIPFVTGIGEATRAIKSTTKLVDLSDDVIDVAKSVRKTLDNATGSYEILYKSGKNYVGKGSFGRAVTSAIAHTKPLLENNFLGDVVTSIRWKKAPSTYAAFIEEYALQAIRGIGNSSTYNKIWSPGKAYFMTLGGMLR